MVQFADAAHLQSLLNPGWYASGGVQPGIPWGSHTVHFGGTTEGNTGTESGNQGIVWNYGQNFGNETSGYLTAHHGARVRGVYCSIIVRISNAT